MLHPEQSRVARCVFELVRRARLPGSDRACEGKPPQDFAFPDRRVPRSPLGPDDAGFPAKRERAADFRVNPAPTAEPPREVLNPKQSLKNDRPRRTDLHPEVVVEGHRSRPGCSKRDRILRNTYTRGKTGDPRENRIHTGRWRL